MTVCILPVKRRGRICAMCVSCGANFLRQSSRHLFCSQCFQWRRVGRLLVAAAKSLRRAEGG
jgi:hypothetical protein